MRKKSNPNRPFMIFNAVLFIAVLGVTAIFLYISYAFKRDSDPKAQVFEGGYQVEITPDFAGESMSVYINDSLLWDGIMPDSLLQLNIHRFAEEHVLILVDKSTDNTTPFNLSKEGGKVSVKKTAEEVVMEEIPSK